MAKDTNYIGILTVSLIFLAIKIRSVDTGKILVLLPLATTSHQIFFHPLINSLAERGHDVIVLTNRKSKGLHSSVKEFLPISAEELMNSFPETFQSRRNGTSPLSFPFQYIIDGCHKVIKSEAFKSLLRSNVTYDLILSDVFVSNCFDGFIYKSGAPFILVTSMPAPSYISEAVGNFLPPSIVPVLSFQGYWELDGQMDFLSRVQNFLHFLIGRLYVHWRLLPDLEKVYRTYLGDDTPGILEIESKAAMIFMNSHFTMNFPRPLLPTVIEIGGMHCSKNKTIKDPFLEDFISKKEAPHGFIYFSVGSLAKMDNAPKEFIQILLTTFAKLNQRVVLKWKRGLKYVGNSTDNIFIPENVYVGDWFSQEGLLGHSNIRLFISHGGLLSLQEAVYHGIPVLGLPFAVDQHANVHNAVLQGYAQKLDVNELSEEILTTTIYQLINNPKFHENAQKISQVFRHRSISPLQTAVFWTEYVLMTNKDNSTYYIHSSARKLNIFQYYSCDILVFLGVLFIIIILAMYFLAKRIRLNVANIMKQRKSPSSKKDAHQKVN